MKRPINISRRDFIKSSLIGGGAVMAAAAMPGSVMAMSREVTGADEGGQSDEGAHDPLLAGVCDLHVHAMPDSRPRSVSEPGMMLDAQQAGYRAVMFKSNDFSCHDRAFVISQMVSGIKCYGSICMNRVHGDRVNPYAARRAVETTGGLCRCIWMPTLDAAYHYRCEGRTDEGIAVVDDRGNVLPEVVEVMEICAGASIMFAAGHSSPAECFALARKAREVGVGKFVVTHANSAWWMITHDQIRQCIDLGAYIELCYLPCLWGEGCQMPQYTRQPMDEFVGYATLDPSRTFISTDLGQAVMPHPVDGMRDCITRLAEAGVSGHDIDLLVRTNPAHLLGLD